MREESIHHQSVYCNDNARNDPSKHKCKVYSDPFLLSIRILDGVVEQRKMLVIWLNSIKGIEAKNEDSDPDEVSCYFARTVISLCGKEAHIKRA